MGKKVLKRKKSVFSLEPDGFSIHTFELSYELTAVEFQQMKEQGCQAGLLYQDKMHQTIYRCTRYHEQGVRLKLLYVATTAGHFRYYLRLVINPRKLIEPGCSYLGILPPEKESVTKLDKSFRRLFKGSPFPHDITRYYLSRVDLCTNLHCDNKRVFRELVRVLRKTRTPDKYKREQYRHKDKKKANRYNKHYLRLSCGTHELVIYDKTYQLTENNLVVAYENLPEGVLRFEVQYKREKLRRVEKALGLDGSTNDPLTVLWHLMQDSRMLLRKHFSACYSKTPFVPIEQIEETIKRAGFAGKTKRNMLQLACLMQRKQTVDKALRDLGRQGIRTDELLAKFEKIGVNPVPLRKGFCCKRLPSPIELLETVGSKPLTVEIEYWKIK